jgi:hypothetical protein
MSDKLTVSERKAKALKALLELCVASSSTSTYEDLYEFKGRSLMEASDEIMDALLHD